MKSFCTLEELCKHYPNQIKLDIPETLICSYDSTVTFIRTNKNGYLETSIISNE